MNDFLRFWLYAMAIPGAIAFAIFAAIVLPGDGDDLTLTRLLTAGAVMISVQFVGGMIGGWLSVPAGDEEPTT